MRKILAFESSCDDTAVAIVDESGAILSSQIYSQVSEYQLYGGVVPEIGSRAHIEQILQTTKAAFKEAGLHERDIDVVAATLAPGLIGPLLVGANFAKGFALARSLPFIGVHHIRGHILAGFGEPEFPKPPFMALVASGGHSALYLCDEHYRMRVIGQTLDDAAGEAFDKIGRALGMGYPAGKIMDAYAREGNPERFKFTIAMQKEAHFNFSFSGLKTQAISCIKAQKIIDEQTLKDICRGVEDSIACALVERSMRAAKHLGLERLVISGGVAANTGLRTMMKKACDEHKFSLFLPAPKLCTDNAVMIGRAAIIALKQDHTTPLDRDVMATQSIESAES